MCWFQGYPGPSGPIGPPGEAGDKVTGERGKKRERDKQICIKTLKSFTSFWSFSLWIHLQIAKFMCTHLDTHFLIIGMHEYMEEIKWSKSENVLYDFNDSIKKLYTCIIIFM